MAEEDIIQTIKERFPDRAIETFKASPKRIYIDVKKEDARDVIGYLFHDLGGRFATASGVDTRAGIEILYHMAFDKKQYKIVTVRALVSKPFPEIDSMATIIPGAAWIEREIHDLFGVNFIGHPDLRRLILADDWPEGKYPYLREEKV